MCVGRTALILLAVTTLLFSLSQPALAGRLSKELPGGAGAIVTDPTAKGTRIPGVVAILYELFNGPSTCGEDVGPDVKMTYFMRLEVHKNVYPFGSVLPQVCYWDFTSQQGAIQAFFKSTVLPFLYTKEIIEIPDACVAIKDASGVVDDLEGDWLDPLKPAFSLMDIVIAIDDKTPCP